MSPSDWERIKQVFSGALAVAPHDRSRYLALACGDATGLRQRVEELLAAHAEASDSFLEPGTLVLDAPWVFKAGEVVADRFTVTRRIARGAMGEVYEAHDHRLRLAIALKAIRPELIGDVTTAERFRREVLVTRDIAHQGLCRVFDLIEHRAARDSLFPEGTSIPCLTMQLLEGETLEDWLRAHRPVAPSDALPLIGQIAEALDVLHQHGVVHRDLKPSNVMLVGEPGAMRAMLTDFGLARPVKEAIFETQTSIQGGAPFFMAPELFRGDRPSRASDIYAFGLLIDEMVTADRAFDCDSLHGLMLQKLGRGPVPPSSRAEHLPACWQHVILRCVATRPDDRFGRASEAYEALVLGAAPWTRLLWSRRRRVWLGAGSLTVAATAVGALAIGTAPPAAPRSVLILPFKNLSGSSQLDYLAAGTTGELGHRLSRMRDVRVFAPSDPPLQVEAKRRADLVLEGQIQRSGARLRLSATLRDGRDGTIEWSDSVEGALDAALQAEERLAASAIEALAADATAHQRRGVAGTLASLSPWPEPSIAADLPSAGTANAAAFDAYLRARHLAEERTLPAALAAADLFRRAIDLDAQYASAYAALADLQAVFMDLHYAPHADLIDEAERNAMQAVAISPDSPDAQLSLAAVRQMQSRWDEADAAFRRAITLHPTFARAHRWYGGMLLQFGRFDEALGLIRRALDLDPYDYPSQSAYGLALFYARRPEDAAVQLEALLAKNDHLHAHLILGQVYGLLAGRGGPQADDYLRKALEQSDHLRRLEFSLAKITPHAPAGCAEYADFVAALAWSFRGNTSEAGPFLERLEAGCADGRASQSILARVYAVQGRAPDALAALEESARQKDRELMYLRVSPLYDRIRSEPRFNALLTAVRLNATQPGGHR